MDKLGDSISKVASTHDDLVGYPAFTIQAIPRNPCDSPDLNVSVRGGGGGGGILIGYPDPRNNFLYSTILSPVWGYATFGRYISTLRVRLPNKR
ncbi:unnamed protein product [Periconia digitata]|uniref:Uncharacterized protein n=1 Tax=Periconia digitata TaxID=1303443 RepID=A0A9W4XV07_9PLEO|nr:unnamed protein product [Periconia digitata]